MNRGENKWRHKKVKFRTWPKSRECMLVRVSEDGKTQETLRDGLDYSCGIDVDSERNVYLAGGRSVIELAAPNYQPVRLGGIGGCGSANRLPSGEIAYLSMRNKRNHLRLLSPVSD